MDLSLIISDVTYPFTCEGHVVRHRLQFRPHPTNMYIFLLCAENMKTQSHTEKNSRTTVLYSFISSM